MISHQGKAALLAGMVLILIAAFAVHAQGVAKIRKEELKAKLDSANIVVLDVRTDHDWNTSQFKIKGALREEPGKVEQWNGKYPKDKKIVLYCA